MAIKTYRKTGKPGVFEEVRETVNKVSLDRLRLKKTALDSMIADYPEPKKRPDREAMDFWNAMHTDQTQRRDLMRQREDLDSTITQLEAISDGENDHVDRAV